MLVPLSELGVVVVSVAGVEVLPSSSGFVDSVVEVSELAAGAEVEVFELAAGAGVEVFELGAGAEAEVLLLLPPPKEIEPLLGEDAALAVVFAAGLVVGGV